METQSRPSQITSTNYLNDLYWYHQSKKDEYKKFFLAGLYEDYENICKVGEQAFLNSQGKTFIWAFVSRELMNKGLLTRKRYEEAFEENQKTKKSNYARIGEEKNFYKTICAEVFKEIALSGKHIMNYIS